MRPEEHLRQAVASHQAGRLAEAENQYRMVLAGDANNLQALRLLGALYLQCGHFEPAEKLLAHANRLNPRDLGAQQNHIVALLEMSRFADAITACDQALSIDSNHVECRRMRADALYQLDRFEEALESYDLVVAQQPHRFEALHHRAAALMALRRLDEAAAGLDEAIAVNPQSADAFRDRGDVLLRLNRIADAMADYDQALELKPHFPEALSGRGRALLVMGRGQEALATLDRALALKSDYAEAIKNRGVAFNVLGRWDEALIEYRRGIGLTLLPDASDYVFEGHLLQHLNRMPEAAEAFDRAGLIDPEAEHLAGGRLNAKLHICDWRNFERDCAAVLAQAEQGRIVGATLSLLAINSTPAQQLAAARSYIKDVLPPGTQITSRPARYDHERIRLAYISSDFRMHPIAMLILDLIEGHDRARFEVTAISLGPDDASPWRARAEKVFDRFVDARDKTDDEIADMIAGLEIDILVDLNGHTKGTRAGILARRPAPVQVNYLGYPGTMGADFMDYMIADRIIIPVEDDAFYAEKIAALPVTYFPATGRTLPGKTPTRADCGLPQAGFVFCAFNNAFKITPDVFDIWMRLLLALDGSVLWLRENDPIARANLIREAKVRGVAAERLIFAPPLENPEDHFARYKLADLFLDTFYYNAHTTASDALWCGLPVLTCKGRSFAGRVGASLLAAIDLPELIAQSPQEYEKLALDLARDQARLAALKKKLAENRISAPLFDMKRFTRDIESAYQTMWQRQLSGQTAKGFIVERRT